MDTTTNNARILKPLGDLSIFPREIRDEIYGHVLPRAKKYRAFYSSSICRPFNYERHDRRAHTDFKRKEWIGSNMSILRLSKAIKDEAMLLLYSEGTFCFRDCINPHDIDVPWHPKADVIDRMTNIELFHDPTCIPEWEMLSFTEHPRCAGARLLEFFQGVSVTRKSILIVLDADDDGWLDVATAMVPWRLFSQLFKVLRHLTGFQTVTLRLLVKPSSLAGATVKEWQDLRGWAKLSAELETLLTAMSQDLEPTLGNSSAMSEIVSGPKEIGFYGQTHVTFHPRDHLAAIPKAKKDAMGINTPRVLSRSTNEAAKSLSQSQIDNLIAKRKTDQHHQAGLRNP